MIDFSDYIESCLNDYPNDHDTYKYKRSVQDGMLARVKEIRSHGLDNEKVIYDLVVSETKEKKIRNGYFEFLKELKVQKFKKMLPFISIGYVFLLLLMFFFVGGVFDLWHPGWLIIEGGITFLIIFLLMFLVSRLNKHKWYPVMRLIVAGSVMILTQFLFLLFRIPFHFEKSYMIFLCAVPLMFICDTVLATLTKQRMVIVNYLICIPIVSVFVYVLLGLLHVVAWYPGWLIIIAGLLIDVGVILGVIKYNQKYTYKPEEED